MIILAYNEAATLERVIAKTIPVLESITPRFSILIVNDGSTDGTEEILCKVNMPNVHVLTHPQNKGYGASMKTGIRRAKGDLIAIADADGTYPIVDFPKLLSAFKEQDADMVIGARTKKGAQFHWTRVPAKWVIKHLVNSMSGRKIPDNNSGMRIFKKSMAEEFMHLYPQGFSFTITITLAAITSDYNVIYVPIDYFKRQGTSSMSSGLNGLKHFFNFIGLIIRITTYFRPLKFFVWPATLLFFGGIAYIGYTIKISSNVSDAGMLMILTGIQIGLFGLLAEVVVRQGRAKRL